MAVRADVGDFNQSDSMLERVSNLQNKSVTGCTGDQEVLVAFTGQGRRLNLQGIISLSKIYGIFNIEGWHMVKDGHPANSNTTCARYVLILLLRGSKIASEPANMFWWLRDAVCANSPQT